MRAQQFRSAVDAEFGRARGRFLTADVVLTALGGRSVDEALAAGVSHSEAWVALCQSQDVPPQRWHGAGLADPPR